MKQYVPPDATPVEWADILAHVVDLLTDHNADIASLTVSGFGGISVFVRGGEDAVDTLAVMFDAPPASTTSANYTRSGTFVGYRVDVYSNRTRTCQCGCNCKAGASS